MKTSMFAVITAVIIACANTGVFADGLVRIPSGTFARGAADGERDEKPVRNIEMSGFGMMAREVTEAQYQRCVEAGRCTPAHYDDGMCHIWDGRQFVRVAVPQNMRGANLPAVCVTWQQARAYCAAQGMRLPTEAEWEYAAMGGAQAPGYAWGNAAPSSGNCAMGAIKPTGSFAPNGYGLYDMTGNAWEWTADFYAADHYETSDAADPKGPNAGYYRVIRGGGWYSGPNELRLKNRHWFAPQSAEVSIGFRCVK